MNIERKQNMTTEAAEQFTHRSAASETNLFSNAPLLMLFENIHRLGTKKVLDSVIKQDALNP